MRLAHSILSEPPRYPAGWWNHRMPKGQESWCQSALSWAESRTGEEACGRAGCHPLAGRNIDAPADVLRSSQPAHAPLHHVTRELAGTSKAVGVLSNYEHSFIPYRAREPAHQQSPSLETKWASTCRAGILSVDGHIVEYPTECRQAKLWLAVCTGDGDAEGRHTVNGWRGGVGKRRADAGEGAGR